MRKLTKQLFKLLKLHSPSGSEWGVIQYLIPVLRDTMDSFHVDSYGNLYAEKKYGDSGYTVLLSSHMDTVANHQPDPRWRKHKTEIYNANGNSALGGDDKCGIAAHLAVIRLMNRQTDFKGTLKVCFSREEEYGCVGAGKAVVLRPEWFADIDAAIVIDRRGADHIINGSWSEKFCSQEYTEFWEDMADKTGFKAVPQEGSISDTMIFSELGINGVNLSAGYYDAHCPTEYIKIHELERTIHWVYNAMNSIERYGKFPTFDYILEPKYKSSWATSYKPTWYDDELYECSECADLYSASDMVELDDGSLMCDLCAEDMLEHDHTESCAYCSGELKSYHMFDYKGFRVCSDCIMDLEAGIHAR